MNSKKMSIAKAEYSKINGKLPFGHNLHKNPEFLSSEETMEGAWGNNKAKKQFDDELEGAGEPQIFSLAGCRLELSNM